MQKRNLRKGLVIGIMFLFIGISINSIIIGEKIKDKNLSNQYPILTETPISFEENKTIFDEIGDVIDVVTGEIYDYPNIDIVKSMYNRTDLNVSLTLKVAGKIEDIGGIYGEEWDNIVTYMFILTTSFDMYTIMYVNKTCVLSTSYEEKNITEYSVEDSVLEVNFNINNTDETYDSLAVDSVYFSFFSDDDMVMAQDTAGDLPLMVSAFVTNPGEAGVEIEFIGYVDYGQSPYEYLWEFGDDETSNERSPTHIYDKPGTYEYTFTVTDDSGATESDDGIIKILKSRRIIIIGRITELNIINNTVSFEAVNIRCIYFSPFQFIAFNQNVIITISDDHIGYINPRMIFAICTILE